MAPGAGLEPATSKLTASCSTIELPGNMNSIIAQNLNYFKGYSVGSGLSGEESESLPLGINSFVVIIYVDYFIVVNLTGRVLARAISSRAIRAGGIISI